MKRHKRMASVAVILLTMLMLTGCNIGKTAVVFTTSLGSRDVFKIDSTVCSISEAKVYLCNYQNLYGSAYGVNLWEHDSGNSSLEEYVKNITISELTRVICMDELAKKQKVALTEEENKKAAAAAKTYYDSLTDDEIDYMDVSETALKGMYEDYALAQKLYTSLTEGVNEEVSDDEARIMEAMQIVVKDQATADKVQNDLNSGRDFTAVATDYNEGTSIAVTFGRGDMPKAVEEAAFNLENDQVSACIQTDGGYYFIKCVNKFNQELTDEHKLTIVKEREKEAFDDVYESFVAGLDSTMNTDLWEDVKVKPSDKITTNSFFEVYEQSFAQ